MKGWKVGLAVVSAIALFAIGNRSTDLYTEAMVVKETTISGVVTLIDNEGEAWEFIDNSNGFKPNEQVTVIMDTNRTIDTRFDDIIVNVHKK